MASLGRVLSLKSRLVVQRGLSAPNPVREVCTSPSLSFRQIKNGDLKRENNEFSKKGSNAVSCGIKYKEAKAVKGFENSRLATSGNTTSNDEAVYSTQSSPTPYGLSTRFGKSLPFHSLISLLKPNINIQQLRYSCNCGCKTCNKCDPECKPKPVQIDLPMNCVNIIKKTTCVIPKQREWNCCGRDIRLPCCCPIAKPLGCKLFDKTLKTCPKRNYKIASYSECAKVKHNYLKCEEKIECCHRRRICYARNIADREIKPLLHIKEWQALTLGFGIKSL